LATLFSPSDPHLTTFRWLATARRSRTIFYQLRVNTMFSLLRLMLESPSNRRPRTHSSLQHPCEYLRGS
jgi:hypothetical protein